MIIKTLAYPRAALVGNPSDGYHGKTIAFVFSNYHAEVLLYETPELELMPNRRDANVYADMNALTKEISMYGYYGGIRLLKAAINRFNRYCAENGFKIAKKNFTMRYSSNIPNRLGLAGSSAIITAAMRAIFRFYELTIEPAHLANLVLSTERDELSIPAGLQDRVAQAYNFPVYMDFDEKYMEEHKVGRYEKLEIPKELKLYVAYRTDLAEGSEILHSRLRDDYESGDKRVHAAMREWAQMTDDVRDALKSGNFEVIPPILNRNFDLRCEICKGSVSAKNLQMVQIAREAGASAKFTGSGGAMIGTYENEEMFELLCKRCSAHGIQVIKPHIVTSGAEL